MRVPAFRSVPYMEARNGLRAAYRKARRLGEAIPLFEHNLAESVRDLGPDHPDTLASRNLAGADESAGRPGEAMRLLEQNLIDSVRLLGSLHPDTLTVRSNLAAAYKSAGW
jgi:hypothetical protein